MTDYDNLSAGAERLYEKAVEEYLSEKYQIRKSGDKFYSPSEPGSPHVGMGGGSKYTEAQMEEKIQEAVSKFEDIPGLFAKFTSMPEPSGFDTPINDMKAAMRSLCVGQAGVADPVSGDQYPYNTELKNMSTSAEYLDEWDGVAMMTFRDEFIAKFEERVLNQFNAAAVIKNAWEAEKELWTRARPNVCKIVDDGYNALDHMHDCGKNEWTVGLSIVGAVVAIGSVVATAGGTAAIALAAVGAAGSVASSAAGTMEDEPKLPYAGESTEAVMNAVREGVQEFDKQLTRAEDKIQTACRNAKGTLEAQSEDYVAAKPRLLDGGDVGRPDAD